MNKFFIKKIFYEKEERTKTIWALVLFGIGILILYFNPLSVEGAFGWVGVLLLFISGYLIGSIPETPLHPKDPFNFDK